MGKRVPELEEKGSVPHSDHAERRKQINQIMKKATLELSSSRCIFQLSRFTQAIWYFTNLLEHLMVSSLLKFTHDGFTSLGSNTIIKSNDHWLTADDH